MLHEITPTYAPASEPNETQPDMTMGADVNTAHMKLGGDWLGRRGASVGRGVSGDGYDKIYCIHIRSYQRINKNTIYQKPLITMDFVILDKEPEA